MTLVEIRDAIVTRALDGYAAAFPDIPLVTENSPFDYNNPPDTFAELDIEFHDGKPVLAFAVRDVGRRLGLLAHQHGMEQLAGLARPAGEHLRHASPSRRRASSAATHTSSGAAMGSMRAQGGSPCANRDVGR